MTNTIFYEMDKISKKYDLVSSKHNQYANWLLMSANKDDFLNTQCYFRYAVENFGAVLAGVLSKMPSLTDERMNIAENVAEEHGHNNIKSTHKETFLIFLKSMNDKNIELNRNSHPYIDSFNQSVLNFVSTHSYYEGAAIVGMIELLYVNISSLIAKTVHSNEWDLLCKQTHYDVHAILDIEHSRELFSVSESMWNTESNVIQKQIKSAAELGAIYFTRLYKDLLEVKHD